jgi:transmembrane sensor
MSADRPSSERTHAESAAPIPPRVHPLEWAVQAGAGTDVLAEMERRIRRRGRRSRRLAGGSLLAVALAVLTWRVGLPEKSPAASDVVEPMVMIETERQTLADGTVVELKPGAAIAPEFSPAARRVVLLRGEAHFEVVKDTLRPFIVVAAGVEVRAVGTAFAVQLGEMSVEVVVTEGRVAVEKPALVGRTGPADESPAAASRVSADPDTLAFVGAGARAVVAVDRAASASVPRVEPMSAAALAERLAWRMPRIELSGTPLVQALAMFNRHAGCRLVLADPKLGRLQISGILRADNVETLLRLLQEEHGIVATRGAEGELHLAKAP